MGKDPEYDLEALKKGLLKCDETISIFEEAIAKENNTKREYRHMISVLEERLGRATTNNG